MKKTLMILFTIIILISAFVGCADNISDKLGELPSDTTEDVETKIPVNTTTENISPEKNEKIEKKSEIIETIPMNFSKIDNPIHPQPGIEAKNTYDIAAPKMIFGRETKIVCESYYDTEEEYPIHFYKFIDVTNGEIFLTLNDSCNVVSTEDGEIIVINEEKNSANISQFYIYAFVDGQILRANFVNDISAFIPNNSYDIRCNAIYGEEANISFRYCYPGENEYEYYEVYSVGTVDANGIHVCYYNKTCIDPSRSFITNTGDWNIEIHHDISDIYGLTLTGTNGKSFYYPISQFSGTGYTITSVVHKGTERELLCIV